MNTKYKNVVDLIKSMDLSEAQKKRQTKYIKARQLSRLLTVIRAQQGLSQNEISEKLDWSQGRVSKLETKEDRKISVGDLLDYSDALGLEMSLIFLPKKMKIVNRVKILAFEMIKLLHRLVKLSKGDSKMELGVDKFHEECINNLIRMIGNSQKTLSPKAKQELTVIGPQQMEQMIKKEDAECVHA